MKNRIGLQDPVAELLANDQVRINVKELMSMRKLKQQELADGLGHSQAWLSKRLTGKTPFQIEDLDVIADAFGLSPAQLLQDGFGKRDRRTGNERRSGSDRRRLGERFGPPKVHHHTAPI